MIDETSTLEDVCFGVASVLDRCSIEAVLTGDSAATRIQLLQRAASSSPVMPMIGRPIHPLRRLALNRNRL